MAIGSTAISRLLARLWLDDPPAFDRYMDELMDRIGATEVLRALDETLIERLGHGNRT